MICLAEAHDFHCSGRELLPSRSPNRFSRHLRQAPVSGRLPARPSVAAFPPPVWHRAAVQCGLTIHSSRTCPLARPSRLNSGVRRQSQHSSVWAVAIISGTVLPASCSSVRHPAMRAGIIIRNCIGHVRSCSPRRASTAGSWLAIVSASPAKVQGRRAQALVASAASQGKGLSPPGFRRSVTPNNSFKPTPLRGAA